MLQQTQVRRVLEKYPVFLRSFPTIGHLAAATRSDVIVAWSGMGYNNRAVRLHRLAQEVVRHHSGKIPRDPDTLRSLPGIGPYTAGALMSSAFREKAPIVDVNIRRVLSRVLRRMRSVHELRNEREIWSLAAALLPVRKSHDWNQALMDLGAVVCTARDPKCGLCPVRFRCASAGHMANGSRSPARSEPSFRGIPNRIHRGKLVELLRSRTDRGGVPIASLAGRFEGVDSAGGIRWLRDLLRSLEKDGLIRRTGKSRIALA
jgi:A/G-specific adenine glycosylase